MKLFWTGSDVLYQKMYPPGIRLRFRIKIFFERIITRLIQPFLECNYADSVALKLELQDQGYKKINIHNDTLLHTEKYPKKPHDNFNIMYYHPKGKNNPEFIEWLYGIDIINSLKIFLAEEKNIKWIRVDGSQDLAEIFPIVDFYVRPTRHDGLSRLRRECEIQEIPYYWANNINPNFSDIRRKIYANLYETTKR